jgi:hypothetical protein
LGYNSMQGNTYAGQNTVVGSGALQALSYTNATTAWATNNVALGYDALFTDQPTTSTNGYKNTALGAYGLYTNATGNSNNAIGYYALYSNTGGSGNVGVGDSTLFTNTVGSYNTALGWKANVGSNNLSNASAIGYNATVNISNAIVLGQTATATKVGIGTASPLQLLHVNGTEQLGTASTTAGSLIFANTTANSVTLNSSNSTAAAYTMTLPTNVATAVNYVLASTGANATLQWVNPATTFSSTITASNGAYMSSATNVQFGTNSLIQNTTLPLSVYTLTETANQAGPWNLNYAHQVDNTNSAGTAFAGINSASYSAGQSGTGIYGQTTQPNGYGVYGTNAAGVGVYGNGDTYGVEGVAAASVGVLGSGTTGTEGNGTAYGIYGIGPIAVYGDANNSTNSAGASFSNNGGKCFSYAAYYNGTNYFGIWADSSIYTETNLTAGGNFVALGTKSTVVEDKDGNSRLMYCSEAPEVLFEDYGTSALVNGRVHIDLDPTYAQNVAINEKHPLRVIVTLNDVECNGVAVINRTSNGFDVVELNHGTTNASFTYEVIANRADKKVKAGEPDKNYSDRRFPLYKIPQTEPAPKGQVTMVK